MKYPIVLQHSEEDCGAACLATIGKHEGSTSAYQHREEILQESTSCGKHRRNSPSKM